MLGKLPCPALGCAFLSLHFALITIVMSTPRTSPAPDKDDGDGIWESQPSSPVRPSSSSSSLPRSSRLASADLRNLRHTHSTLGYRDGITAGKAGFIQPGFDEGYPLGGRIGLRVGWIQGVLRGLAFISPLDSEVARAVRDAERELSTEAIFSGQWWDSFGVWRWPVDRTDADGDATLDDVVDAFPVLSQWLERVHALAQNRGLDADILQVDANGQPAPAEQQVSGAQDEQQQRKDEAQVAELPAAV